MSNCIKLLLSGGIGNQLFQYASLRALALRLNVPLVVDLRFYSIDGGDPSKRPWLTDFPISSEIQDYPSRVNGAHAMYRRIFRHLISERPSRIYRSTAIGFDEKLSRLHNGLVVSGLFQSPKHFDERWSELAVELDLFGLGLLDVPAMIEGKDLSSCVGVHVRRGDYLSHSGFEMRDPADYYRRGIDTLIDSSCSDIIVFTDDAEWCRRQQVFSNAKYFLSSERPPYVDMFTMSRCGRLVIANSTYSWWAAWFASRRGTPVVAPAEWILGLSSKELGIIPPGWILM